MAERIEALVNPKILVWARKKTGFDLNGVAKRLKVKPERIESWEEGDSRPTINQAMQLAEIYRRPLSLFYLILQREFGWIIKDTLTPLAMGDIGIMVTALPITNDIKGELRIKERFWQNRLQQKNSLWQGESGCLVL